MVTFISQLIDSLEGTNVFNVDIGRKIVSITTDIEKVMLKDLALLRKEITKTVKDAGKEEKKLRADLGSAESSAKSVCIFSFFKLLKIRLQKLYRQNQLI